MKQKIKISLGILILILGIMASGCGNKKSKEKAGTEQKVSEVVYTCPMHSEVEMSEPGNCPKCGMELVEKDSTMEKSHEGHMD